MEVTMKTLSLTLAALTFIFSTAASAKSLKANRLTEEQKIILSEIGSRTLGQGASFSVAASRPPAGSDACPVHLVDQMGYLSDFFTPMPKACLEEGIMQFRGLDRDGK